MEYLNITSVIILFVTLLAIIVYTFETIKLRKINYKIFNLESLKMKPNLVIYLDYTINNHTITLILENIGGSPAYDVKLKLKPELNTDSENIINEFKQNVMSNNGIPILIPHQRYSTIIGTSVESYELVSQEKIPSEYMAYISFRDDYNRDYSKNIKLDISALFFKPYTQDDISKTLYEINDSLKEISRKFNSMQIQR